MLKIRVQVQVTIRDKNGKIVKTIKRTCHSYVRQWADLLRCQMSQSSTAMTDTNGDPKTQSADSSAFAVNAGSGIDTYGIQAGSDPTPVSISDHKIGSLILHGNGAGELAYGVTTIGDVSVVGSTATFIITRIFTNNSGAAIDVKEIALVTDSVELYLLERTLLPFTILNTKNGTVTYTINITV